MSIVIFWSRLINCKAPSTAGSKLLPTQENMFTSQRSFLPAVKALSGRYKPSLCSCHYSVIGTFIRLFFPPSSAIFCSQFILTHWGHMMCQFTFDGGIWTMISYFLDVIVLLLMVLTCIDAFKGRGAGKGNHCCITGSSILWTWWGRAF